MRILRVAQKCYPDVKGGGPYHVHAMSRDQAAMGHDVTVLTVRYDDSLPHVEERAGYTVVRYDPAVTLLGNDISPGVAQYLRSVEDFDVIHAHSHLYFSTNLAALERVLSDVPLAITNHGLYSQNAPEWVFDLYLRTLGRWTFNRADVVFCYTETDKRRVQEYGVSSRIEVVANGIDTERFTPEGPESELVDAEGPVVLFVGRLVEGKRPWIVVEAFAEMLETHPDAELYLCGEGPLRKELEARISELKIEESTTFLGHVPYDEMPKVYRSGNVLVLPSRAEGLPRTVLEAMASGVPPVVNDLEQMHSVVGDGGETVAIEDGTELCESVCRVLGSNTYERKFESTAYEWNQTVERTTAILKSLP